MDAVESFWLPRELVLPGHNSLHGESAEHRQREYAKMLFDVSVQKN